MAFSTLNALRALLNTDLGRTDGSTTPWGTDTDCNTFLQMAFRHLWPRVGRLVRETITPTDETMDYTLTSIRDVVTLEHLDSDGLFKGRVASWRLVVDESADPVVRRIIIPELATETTVRVTGYAPYSVPASGASTCDLPNDMEHIVVIGARAEAYRRRMNEYIDFEQRNASNPVTSVQEPSFDRAYLTAKAEFEQLLTLHGRNHAAPRRAITTVR